MDPDAALDALNEVIDVLRARTPKMSKRELADLADEAVARFDDLTAWVDGGGFPPRAWGGVAAMPEDVIETKATQAAIAVLQTGGTVNDAERLLRQAYETTEVTRKVGSPGGPWPPPLETQDPDRTEEETKEGDDEPAEQEADGSDCTLCGDHVATVSSDGKCDGCVEADEKDAALIREQVEAGNVAFAPQIVRQFNDEHGVTTAAAVIAAASPYYPQIEEGSPDASR